MTTFVGKQADLADFLKSLLELEYDAIAAYSTAVDRLDELSFKLRFEQFRADHERHTRTLSDALLRLGVDPPERPDVKAILTQGRVVVGKLRGDRGVLTAMRANENDTNTAYERAVAPTSNPSSQPGSPKRSPTNAATAPGLTTRSTPWTAPAPTPSQPTSSAPK